MFFKIELTSSLIDKKENHQHINHGIESYITF